MTRSKFREGRLYVRPQHGFDLSCLLVSAASRDARGQLYLVILPADLKAA